eukprot:gb/GECG01008773.1/.p1 GENE.gb/GECG01008773.1/~~gb/GECG01008773.1/.p1  ORF type:complete len:174 (+),score=8.97 gb/GECG01008773.1/:1-522(+)
MQMIMISSGFNRGIALHHSCWSAVAFSTKAASPGTLFMAAMPIGNYDDITIRAFRELTRAKLIAAEDTRVIRKLLRHHLRGVNLEKRMPHIIRLDEYTVFKQTPKIVSTVLNGDNVVYVSDAGKWTPLTTRCLAPTYYRGKFSISNTGSRHTRNQRSRAKTRRFGSFFWSARI